MRSRVATVLTIVALLAGTGGAIALGQSGSSHGTQPGAATAQYKPTKKKCKKGFHRVRGKCVKNGRKSKSGVKGLNNARSRAPKHTGARFTG